MIPALMAGPGNRLYLQENNWQLEAGHFQASIHTLDLAYPRPDDDDVEDWALHKRMPSTYTRKIALVPIGGSPPWYVVVNSGPCTVENDPDSDDYLVLTFTTPSVSTATVSVTLHDQAGASVNREWAWECIDRDDTDYFVHLDDGEGGTEAGTSSNPVRSLSGILGPNSDSTTWQGRQLLLAGNHTLSGLSASYDANDSRLEIGANQPLAWAAVTIGGATLDGSALNADGACLNPLGAGFTLHGINFIRPHLDEVGGGAGERNCFLHTSSAGVTRGGAFFCDFDMDADPQDEGANSAAIHLAQNGDSDYVTLAHCTFRNVEGETSAVQWYATTFQVVFKCKLVDSTSDQGFYIKGDAVCDDFGFYFCEGFDNVTGNFAQVDTISGGPPWSRQRIEFMHCRVKAASFVGIGASGAEAPATLSLSLKRNSFKGAALVSGHGFDTITDAFLTSAYNCIEHSAGTQGIDLTDSTITPSNSNNEAAASGIVDDTTVLRTGGADGIHGAEIA